MSDFLQQYRHKYPQYDDLNDSQLTTALHAKYNFDTGSTISFEEFNAAIGYEPIQSQPASQGTIQNTAVSSIPEGGDEYSGIDSGIQQKSMSDLIKEKAAALSSGPSMVAYEPSIWEKIKSFFPDNKDAAWVELQAREIAKEKGISVDEAYQIAGGSRPIFNPEGRAPIQAAIEASETVADEIPDLIPGAANTILRSIRGGDESADDDSWIDRAINYTEPEKKDYNDPNYQAFQGIGKSLGYSLSTMTSSATTGALTFAATKNPYASAVVAGTTGGTVAYRGSRDEFLSKIKDTLDKESQKIYGRKLNQSEWDKAYKEFDQAATKYGAWEAIPESVSNLVFLRAFSAPLKGVGKKKLQEITKRAAAAYSTENVTETTTTLGQNRTEVEAGLADKEISAGEAFKKQVVPTTIVTGLMGGGAYGVQQGLQATKTKERRLGDLLNEIAESTTLVDDSQEVAQKALDPQNAQIEQVQNIEEKSSSNPPKDSKQDVVNTSDSDTQKAEPSYQTENQPIDQRSKSDYTVDKVASKQGLDQPTSESKLSSEKSESVTDARNKSETLTIKTSIVGAQSGQTDSEIIAYQSGIPVGKLEYSEYKGKPAIKMVDVLKEHQRKGIATKLIQKLQSEYPNIEIDIGLSSKEGGAWYKSLSKQVVENKEFKDKSAELSKIEETLSHYKKLSDEFRNGSRSEKERQEFREKTKNWNDLNDKADDLRDSLSEMPERTVLISQPENPSTKKSQPVEDITNSIKDSYQGLRLNMSNRGENKVEINQIIVPEEQRNQGVGSTVMGDITQWADTNGKTITLSPSSDFGGSVVRLKKFYKSFGFVENKGKNKDYEISESMYRLPKQSNDNQEKNSLKSIENNKKAKKQTDKSRKFNRQDSHVYDAPGANYVGMYRSTGIPERKELVYIDGKKVSVPQKPQRIEPIIKKLTQIIGRRIYFGKIQGKSTEGFYRDSVGEIRTRKKNDVEVLAHEMAHYLDMYSNDSLPNFEKLYKDKKYSNQVMALSYTDSSKELQKIEGFAEFVRLWLTNSREAQLRAPDFYDAFTTLLSTDSKLDESMKGLQESMHRFYFQGADNLGKVLIGKDYSFAHQFDGWKYRRDSRIRQQFIDRFHAARKIEQELTNKIGGVNESAWKQFRIASGGAEGIADYIMNYGTVNFDNNGDLKRTGDSLHTVLQPVKSIELKDQHKDESKIDLLMRYFSGRRAIELHKQKRENLIPKETAMEWARLGKDYPIFESIHKNYQAFNKRMMDFYVTSGMITPEGRKAMESMNKDYVPFNRIRETLVDGRNARSSGFKKLKGGTANLNDILVNIQDGIVSNTRAALNNRAKQRLYQYISGHKDGAIFATRISPDSRKVKIHESEMANKIAKVLQSSGIEIEGALDLTDPTLMDFWQHGVKPQLNESGNMVDTVIIDGKRKYYEVQDPLLQEMLLGMNPESYSTFMNIMFGVKNFFTRMITLGVEFTGANLVRDTIGAGFISKNNFTPFIDSFKGMYSFISRDKYFQDFMRSGGGFSSRLHGSTREVIARRKVDVDEFGVMSASEKIFSAIDNIASAFEYGTRIGEFRLAKKNNLSDADAAFSAREISSDFSAIGANHFLTGYIRTVPFLNAMIQSQDRIFREAIVSKRYDGNPSALAMKAFLGLTVPTLILYLINKDDEDYQQIPDHEKRTNWHIKINDNQFVKIPRPYDVGFVYATMPELFFKYVEDDKGKEFADGMIWTLAQMYGIDATPAIMTGWWDLVRNKKWTGSPVVPRSLSNVAAPEQYTSNTSETFIRFGEVTGLSPIKAEHLFKAYTGYLGGYLMWGTDHLLWDESKFGEKPDRKASNNIFLRRFLTPDTRPNGAAMEKFFKLKEKSDKVVTTFKKTVDTRRAIRKKQGDGKFKDDKFFGLSAKEKEVLFTLNDSMNQLVKLIYGKEGIKTAELKIRHDKSLTGSEKRKKIDNLWRVRNSAFMQYYQQANKALEKAKQESKQEN